MSNQSHDIRRLPVWAQEKIQSLDEEVLRLKAEIDQLRGAVGASNVFVKDDTAYPGQDIGLGMNKRLRFQFPVPAKQVTMNFVDVRHERDRRDRHALVIQADRTLLIEAHATNSLVLILEDR